MDTLFYYTFEHPRSKGLFIVMIKMEISNGKKMTQFLASYIHTKSSLTMPNFTPIGHSIAR